MYGFAVNLIMSVSGHPSIINEINKKVPIQVWLNLKRLEIDSIARP